jgi:hypothetical protein
MPIPLTEPPLASSASAADKLLFVLVYLKTYPLQVVLGQLFGVSTSQANYWLHHLLPALRSALDDLFLSGTHPGTAHDKRIADVEQLTYPPETTLYKDSGFQQRKRKQGVEKKKCTRTGDSALYYVRTA